MASKPDAPKLPTPTAPVPSASIKLGSETTDTKLNTKVKGLKQLQIKKKQIGLSSDTSTGLNT